MNDDPCIERTARVLARVQAGVALITLVLLLDVALRL